MASRVFQSKIVVKRHNWVRYSRRILPNSGYCEDQGTTQFLVKEYKLFGRTIFKVTLDSEEVPAWALIEQSCFGGTEWTSKFYNYMR